MLCMNVTKKGMPLTNMKSEDNVTDWYLYIRCLGVLMYLLIGFPNIPGTTTHIGANNMLIGADEYVILPTESDSPYSETTISIQ